MAGRCAGSHGLHEHAGPRLRARLDGVGNAIVDWLSTFCGRLTTLLLWAAGLQSAAAVFVGLSNDFWVALAGMVVLAGAIGMTGPVKQAYLHAGVASAQRASVVSFDSMFGNGGGVAGQAGLGWISRARSIEDGYVLGGLAMVLAMPLYWRVRAIGGAPDVIVGDRAGVSARAPPRGCRRSPGSTPRHAPLEPAAPPEASPASRLSVRLEHRCVDLGDDLPSQGQTGFGALPLLGLSKKRMCGFESITGVGPRVSAPSLPASTVVTSNRRRYGIFVSPT